QPPLRPTRASVPAPARDRRRWHTGPLRQNEACRRRVSRVCRLLPSKPDSIRQYGTAPGSGAFLGGFLPGEAVTDTPDRVEVNGMAGLRLEHATQSHHHVVHGTAGGPGVLAPHFVKDEFTAHDLTLMPCQQPQYPVLPLAQHFLAAVIQAHLPGAEVNGMAREVQLVFLRE